MKDKEQQSYQWQVREIEDRLLAAATLIQRVNQTVTRIDPSQFCTVGCEYVEVGEEERLSRVIVLNLNGDLRCDLRIDTGDEETGSNANQTTEKDEDKIPIKELFSILRLILTEYCVCFKDVPRTFIDEVGFPPKKYDYCVVQVGDMLMEGTIYLLGGDPIMNTKVALLTHYLALCNKITSRLKYLVVSEMLERVGLSSVLPY